MASTVDNVNNDKDYRKMLQYFRTNDLRALLEAFGQNNVGQRTTLRKRALELLNSIPKSLNYAAYLSTINEIYNQLPSVRSDISNNKMMHSSMETEQSQMMSMSQNQIQQLQYNQQSMNMSQASLPHDTTKMEGCINGNPTGENTIPGNTMANNHNQYVSGSYQPVSPQNILPYQIPSNQQHDTNESMTQSTLALSLIPSQTIANCKFKKLPFYDVREDIIKPTLLIGSGRYTLSNFVEGMEECKFEHTMSNIQASLIAKNLDLSFGKNKYDMQYQIRICQLKNYLCNEVTDYFPMGLCIRVGNHNCPLPPNKSHEHNVAKIRRVGRPINITEFLKLSPLVTNVITINWVPDGKKYALAMYIVKQLSIDTLMKKLHNKKARSSEETKNHIIKKLTNVDPDLTTTSSYNFSLICPLSKVRMKIPAKSIHCDHIQCFDARTFILMNEKKPNWRCPTCNKSCLYDDIQIENYFLQILTSPTLRDDINVIEILADGSWIIPEENKNPKNMNSTIDNKRKIDFIDLDDINDEKCIEVKEKLRSGGSECQGSENLKPHIVDLTIDEDED